jgi:hypothetical protein
MALTWDNATGAFVATALFTGGLLATGATTGATSQAQTFTNGIIGPSWKPSANSTTALQLQNATGTAIATVDTSNGKFGIGATPTGTLTIKSGSTAYANLALSVLDSSSASIFGACDDGRVYVGTKAVYDVPFEVNTGNFAGATYILALVDGSKTLQFAPTSIQSNQANFSFGANSNGAAIAMYSPLNYGLVVWGNQAAINRQGPYAPKGQFDVFNDVATRVGLCIIAKTGQSANLTNWYAADQTTVLSAVSAAGWFGAGLSTPATVLHGLLVDAATNAVTNVLTLGHDTTGTAAAGFGAGQLFTLESSTTAAQSAARIQALWNDATHATRKADLVLTAYDSGGEREGLRIRGNGSAAAIGFLGATPAARQAHVADPSGGATVDAEARTAINAILATLETFGLHATS